MPSDDSSVLRGRAFYDHLETVIPWAEWMALVETYCSGRMGASPFPLEAFLRIYVVQLCYHFSDEEAVDMVCDSLSVRHFTGFPCLDAPIPSAALIRRFRHIMEKHHLGKLFLKDLKRRLKQEGRLLQPGTIIDSDVIKVS